MCILIELVHYHIIRNEPDTGKLFAPRFIVHFLLFSLIRANNKISLSILFKTRCLPEPNRITIQMRIRYDRNDSFLAFLDRRRYQAK